MQILHSALSRPQPSTDSTRASSPPLLQIRRESSSSGSDPNLPISIFPVSKDYLVSLCSGLVPSRSKPSPSMNIYLPTPPYLRVTSATAATTTTTAMDTGSEPEARTPVVTTGDSRRNNPSGDDSRKPGDHYKDTCPPRLVPSDEAMETEEQPEDEDDSTYEVNGFKFQHSDQAHLIVNLYNEERRNGYTYSVYLPETEDEEAKTFEESRLFLYAEKYIIDSVNTETIPVRLVRRLEKLNGIELTSYQNCVPCEIRDFRRFPSAPKNDPVVRRVLLKPNNQTMLSDLNQIIEQSYEQQRNYRNAIDAIDEVDPDHFDEDGVPLLKRRRFEEDENEEPLPSSSHDVLTLDQRNEAEKRLVKETAGKLCLNPSKQVGLFANRVQYEKFKWNAKGLRKTVDRWVAKKRKIELLRKYDLQADTAEDEAVPGPGVSSIDAYDRELTENTCKSIRDFVPLLKFIQKTIRTRKLKRESPKQTIQLHPAIYVDYPDLPLPTNPEEFSLLGVAPEPSAIRSVNSENSVRQTQEYIFETERRKRPHRTRLTIYQRNGMESFFGELEQEAYIDTGPDSAGMGNFANLTLNLARGPPTTRPNGVDSANNNFPCSKCQFELGSSKSVDLYVRQFSDIFTEDGRRPCKIVYQKLGQTIQNININNYKPAPASFVSNPHNTSSNTVIISHNGVPPPPHDSSKTIIVSVPASFAPVSNSAVLSPSQGTPPQSQPPVQIVHPQPRPQPIQIYSNGHLTTLAVTPVSVTTVSSITSMPTMTQTATAANLNLNLNLNPTRILQQQQQQNQQRQQLTRPQIYNVNLGQQQQQGNVITRPTSTIHTAPQLIQPQQGLRMKQLPTLSSILLAGIPNSNNPSKPITVTISPQPQTHQNQGNLNQNQIHINNTLDHHQQPQHQQLSHGQVQVHNHQLTGNPNQIFYMVTPAQAHSIASSQGTITIPPNATGHHHHAGSVSVNLNAINLDSLLSASNSNSTNYITSTTNALGLGTSSSNTSVNTLNILRLSNSTSTVTLQPQQIIRQNPAVSVMNPTQTNLVSMHSGATGILINHHNSGSTVNSSTNSGSTGIGRLQHQELEEISVPDLNSLLNNGPTRVTSGNYSRTHSNGTSIDLNLNLNVNLSGTPPTASRAPSTNGSSNEHYEVQNGRASSQNGNVNVNCVDSIFNALSDAIGPDLGHRLDNSMTNTGIGLVTSSMSPSHTKNASPAITLNDLLGSPPMVPSPALSANHLGSSPSPQSPISPSIHVSSSSLAYGTPRLSALLAGSPSADSSNLLVDSSSVRGGGVPNYGNLLDRLMAQQPQGTNQRVSGSRLNPIATATPNVVLEHPMLAATLTQGSNPSLRQALTRPTAYRQIAPAPPPNLQPQQQQLMNLLGLVGATATGNSNPGQAGPQTLRINSGNTKPSAGASGSLGGR